MNVRTAFYVKLWTFVILQSEAQTLHWRKKNCSDWRELEQLDVYWSKSNSVIVPTVEMWLFS